MVRATAPRGPFVLALSLLALAFLLAWGGVREAGRALQAQAEARRWIAQALRTGRPPEEAERLFQRAREIDLGCAARACEEGFREQRAGHWAQAAARYADCIACDPEELYAHKAHAQMLVWGPGREAYVESRAELRRFVEGLAAMPIHPPDSPEPPDVASRRAAEDLISELEEFLAPDATAVRRRHTAEEILEILTRPRERGASRYEGPRVPLRLSFRPNDTVLGSGAEAELREVARALHEGQLAAARIQIEGHTDSVEGGSRAGRLALARQRAEAVRQFLLTRGRVPPDRLRVEACADDYPLSPNQTAEGRDANRRVELINLEEKKELLRDVRER
jgi:outer membrane protein OmpA-like peptidoglycan-associated protein